MTAAPFAERASDMLKDRPHVGVVTHKEGLGVPAAGARLGALLVERGLSHEDAVEDIAGLPVYNALAVVPAGTGMTMWLIASEVRDVGCKVEMRIFHKLDEGAPADEYLAEFAQAARERL